MQPQTPPTQGPLQRASTPDMSRFAFDWVDAIGILILMSGLGFLFHHLGEEIPLILSLPCLLAVPVARRRWLGVPFRTVARRFSLLGLLSSALIIFGTLGGALLIFGIANNARRVVEPLPVFESSIVLTEHLPDNATPEQRAAFEARNQIREREKRELREAEERRAREEQARDEEARQALVRTLLLWCAAPVGMVALGGFLDSLRMRWDSAR